MEDNNIQDSCCNSKYASIRQMDKLDEMLGRRFPFYPRTVIQAVHDGRTGASLEAILAQYNNIYVQYQGTAGRTRNIVPKEMRRKGIIISYVDMQGNAITEKCVNDAQRDNFHWGLDVNWVRVDELTLSGDISVSVKGTWVINGEDTGIAALGPKGDNGLTPWLKTIDNKLHFSYDNETWEVCSDYIAAYFRFQDNKFQISRDNKTWSDLSGEVTNSLSIKAYVTDKSQYPNPKQGDMIMVGPTYADDDTEHTKPIYHLNIYNAGGWVDHGPFQSINASVVQELGDSETEVMSQKAVSEKISELGNQYKDFSLVNGENIQYELIKGKYINNDGIEKELSNYSYAVISELTNIIGINVFTITGADAPFIIWFDSNDKIIYKVIANQSNSSSYVQSLKPFNAAKCIVNTYGTDNLIVKKLLYSNIDNIEAIMNIQNIYNGYNSLIQSVQNSNSLIRNLNNIHTISGAYYKDGAGNIGSIESYCIRRYLIPKGSISLFVKKATFGVAFNIFFDKYDNIISSFAGAESLEKNIDIPVNAVYVDFSVIEKDLIDIVFNPETSTLLDKKILALQNQIGYGDILSTKNIINGQYYSNAEGKITELEVFCIEQVEIPQGATSVFFDKLSSGAAYNLIRDIDNNIIDSKTGDLSATEWQINKNAYLLEICYSVNNGRSLHFNPGKGIVKRIEHLSKFSLLSEKWNGKKIAIVGTSVAFGMLAKKSYAKDAAEILGAEIVCMAIPGLAIHCGKKEDGTLYPINTSGSSVLSKAEYDMAKDLGYTSIEIPTEPISGWEAGGTSNRYYATWENIFNEENNDIDLWVFATIPNNTNFDKTDWDLFKKPDVETAYDVNQWGYTDSTTFDEHRTTFLGAMLFLIDKMYKLNENARMVLVIDSPFQYKNGKEAFQLLQETFGIPVVDLWGKMQWTTPAKKILLSENGTDKHPSAFAQEKMGKIFANELLLVE